MKKLLLTLIICVCIFKINAQSTVFPIEYQAAKSKDVVVTVKCVSLYQSNISWEIKGKKFIGNQTVNGSPSRQSTLLWYNDSTICLGYGCGTNCYNYCVLTTYKNISIAKLYQNPLLIDSVRKIIIYQREQDNSFATCENYLTKKRIGLMPNHCYCLAMYCYDTMYFNNNQFIVKWKMDNLRNCNNGEINEKETIYYLPDYIFGK